MLDINEFINGFSSSFIYDNTLQPWEITGKLNSIIEKLILKLDHNYVVTGSVAIHRSAVIEKGVTLKNAIIISEGCYVGANSYFREGVFLDKSVKIGPGCEIKSSIISLDTAVAHFNYIGNSIIGRHVNFEAGSIAANHYNERKVKDISVLYRSEIINTNVAKFGSLVGDDCKIGANAVLSPGTILERGTIVKRLELIEQIKTSN
jgi:NDP-sugar pyrophosphorylase family protein